MPQQYSISITGRRDPCHCPVPTYECREQGRPGGRGGAFLLETITCANTSSNACTLFENGSWITLNQLQVLRLKRGWGWAPELYTAREQAVRPAREVGQLTGGRMEDPSGTMAIKLEPPPM